MTILLLIGLSNIFTGIMDIALGSLDLFTVLWFTTGFSFLILYVIMDAKEKIIEAIKEASKKLKGEN